MNEANTQRPPEAAGQPRPRRSSAQRKRQQSVLTYIVVLFLAAFLLLLLSLFMERRQNNEVIGGLTDSVTGLRESMSAMQSVQSLYDENAALKEQVDRLEQELAEAQSQLDVLPDTISHLEHSLEETRRAMDYFWQVNEAYVRGRYKLCRQLIGTMQEQQLVEFLPKESTTDNDRFSPADRYQEIYDALY